MEHVLWVGDPPGGWSGEVEVDKRIRQLKLIDCTNMGKFVLSIEV